jgi:hypothetical protein
MRELQTAAGNFCRDESAGLVERITENLGESGERSLRAQDQEILKAAHEALTRSASAFTSLLRQHFASGVIKAIEAEKPAGEPERISTGATQRLELIGMEDMEREVLIVNLVRKLEDYCAETLSPLTLRLGHLRGVDTFQLDLNAFRPEVFVRAFINAWEAFDTNKNSTRVMLSAMHTTNFLPLNALYLELNKLLIARGVMREQKYIIKRTASPKRDQDALWTRSHVLPDEDADPSAAIAAYNALLAASAAAGIGGGGGDAGGPLGAGAGYQFNPARFMHQVTLLLEHVGASAHGAGASSLGAGTAAGAGAADSASTATASAGLAAPSAQLMARLDALLAQHEDERAHLASATETAAGSTIDAAGALSITQIESLREAPETLSSNELDRATIEMVGRVFQFVLDDANLPTGLKVLIARLQLPALKAALSDRSFFVREDHPARQLIDALAKAGVYWDDRDAAFGRTLAAIVEDVGNPSVDYALLTGRTEAAIAEQQQLYEARIASSIEEANRAEQRDDARRDMGLRMERRIAEKNVDDTLAEFLRGPWRDALSTYFVDREANPEAWNTALAKTDILIWSVMPKSAQSESNQLRAELPSLLATLSAGLDRVDFSGEPRVAFMNYLMERQAQSVRRMASASMAAVMATSVPSAAPAALAAPQEAASEEDGLDAVDLPFDIAGATVDSALVRDQWFVLDLGLAEPLRYRLSWISPKRTKFVFTNRDGAETLVKPLAEVEEWLVSGALRPIEAAPIVQRAIASTAA